MSKPIIILDTLPKKTCMYARSWSKKLSNTINDILVEHKNEENRLNRRR
jgi:hypothetical protein